jgi:cobalamin biosynthesis protein CobD/CbiB
MKNRNIEIKWGFIFILMMVIWMALERAFGLHDENIHLHPIVTNFIFIPAVTIYVLALLEKRKKSYGGYMTYGQGFVSGVIITLVVTIFTPLLQYLTSTVITPEYFTNAIAHSVAEGYHTQESAEAYFNLRNYMIQATIGAPIMGLLTTAIVALFTRRSPK